MTSSPVSYPDDETLARSEAFAELGVEATQTMNDLWLSVKTSTSNTTLYLILTITAIAAVILFFLISGIIKRRKRPVAAAGGSRPDPNTTAGAEISAPAVIFSVRQLRTAAARVEGLHTFDGKHVPIAGLLFHIYCAMISMLHNLNMDRFRECVFVSRQNALSILAFSDFVHVSMIV